VQNWFVVKVKGQSYSRIDTFLNALLADVRCLDIDRTFLLWRFCCCHDPSCFVFSSFFFLTVVTTPPSTLQNQASLNTYLTKRIAAFYGLYMQDKQVLGH
jgi:hypothetical protein